METNDLNLPHLISNSDEKYSPIHFEGLRSIFEVWFENEDITKDIADDLVCQISQFVKLDNMIVITLWTLEKNGEVIFDKEVFRNLLSKPTDIILSIGDRQGVIQKMEKFTKCNLIDIGDKIYDYTYKENDCQEVIVTLTYENNYEKFS